MVTIHDAGGPHDADLPTLTSAQLDRIVDQLTASSAPPVDGSAVTAQPVVQLSAPQLGDRRNRGKWQRRAGVAAVAAAVTATVVLTVQDNGLPPAVSSAGGPALVVQAPAPNFDCWNYDRMVHTDRAVYLPADESGRQLTAGIAGDTLCWAVLPNGGGETVPADALAPGPVPYFGSSGYRDDQYAYGLVNTSITRIEFVPDDTSTSPREAAQLVDFGNDRAFLLPDVGSGTVRFYRGTVLAAEKLITRLPRPVAEPVPTGLPCDPTATGARLNTSSLTATDDVGETMFTELYLEPIEPGQPASADRRLCLLVQSAQPAISAAADLRDTEAPISYLATTPGNGGVFIWGRLSGDATDLKLIDSTGNTSSLPDEQRDSTRSGQVSFVTFRLDTAPPVISVQAVDDNGTPLGAAVQLP